MVIAGVVIETLPGKAEAVAIRLADFEGLAVRADDGDRRLAAIWNAPNGKPLRKLAQELLHWDNEILGVYPTLVGEA